MIRTPAAFLTDGEVRRVHEASLEILEQVGLLVRNARAREIFAHHGCKVEAGGESVRFPRAVVERHRAGIPASSRSGRATRRSTGRCPTTRRW